jgi:hypothetical protein
MELLGNEEFAIRLGGILQLETLAQQSRRLHWPIMEAFCGYLREQRPAETKENDTDESDSVSAFPADLQAIVTAIRRRNLRHDPVAQQIPLARADLSGADLTSAFLESADFKGARLQDADISHSHLGRANFTGANLRHADLRGANLESVRLAQRI